jgi:Bacterial pre-peptidase C-terminal domain
MLITQYGLREIGMRHVLLYSASLLAVTIGGAAFAQRPAVLTDIPSVPPAAAQTAPSDSAIPATIGQTIRGTIGPNDRKLAMDNSPYKIYRVRVPVGQRLVATLTSTAFQPVLGIGVNIDDNCEGCTINVGETDKPAVAAKMSEGGGFMEVRVNTMNEGDSGAFTLALTAVAPAPLTAAPLTFGQSRTGALTSSDATTGDDDLPTDAYALRLTAGQSVQIDLSSSEFDPKLELMAPGGGKVQEDDDGGPGNSARIRFTAPRAGTYQIRAMALQSGGTGAYTLRAGARPAVVPMPAPRPLVLGTAVSGAITSETPSYENEGEEVRAVRYSFYAAAGSIYRITATKRPGSEIDPRISVGKLVNGVLADPSVDDDGAGDLNSALRFRPSGNGVHVIEVSAVGETSGTYDVKVVQSPPDRPAGNPIAVTLGTESRGTLSDGGPRNASDNLFLGYSITLKTGQQVTIDMLKEGEGSFDPKLEIGRGTLTAFDQIAEDDDGGRDLNARIKFTAPSDGTYIIRATTVSVTNEGAFTLKVDTTPPPVMPPAPSAIQSGQVLRGALAATDPSLPSGSYYDRYVLNGQPGDTYEISVSAENLDVMVGARSALREDDDYVTDDDGGGGTNAKLTYTVTVAGPQVIRVSSLGEEAMGDYTISVLKK